MIRYDERIDVNAGRNQLSSTTNKTTSAAAAATSTKNSKTPTNSSFFPTTTASKAQSTGSYSCSSNTTITFASPHLLEGKEAPTSSYPSEQHHLISQRGSRTILGHNKNSLNLDVARQLSSDFAVVGNSTKLFNRRLVTPIITITSEEYEQKRKYNTKRNSIYTSAINSSSSGKNTFLSQFARKRLPSYASSSTRVPPLLAQAFAPELNTSYSYKCSVRTKDKVLKPQSVTLVWESEGILEETQKSGERLGIFGK